MNLGKTIQIYLPDGNPRSVKVAEFTSRTIQAIQIPRSKLEYALTRKELENVGVYFLIGNENEESKPLLYIGETEDCKSRIKEHNAKKDFWNHAVMIISKTQYFTKTHVKWLEWYCHELSSRSGRFKVDNSNNPSKPYISESMEADLLDNFETISILVSSLGFPIFDQISKPKSPEILICKGKDALAEGEYSEDGLIVFKNSLCNLQESKTAGSWVSGMRQKLIEENILVKDNETYKFVEDHVFSSPSAAAAVVLARRANGWIEWKYKNGKTLDEVKRQNTISNGKNE
jgi:predicted GIY-YIG superfamily endonuclease